MVGKGTKPNFQIFKNQLKRMHTSMEILGDMRAYQFEKCMDWVDCVKKNIDDSGQMSHIVWGIIYR